MVFEDKERSFGPQYYLDRQTRNSARPNIEHCSHVKIGHCNVKGTHGPSAYSSV